MRTHLFSSIAVCFSSSPLRVSLAGRSTHDDVAAVTAKFLTYDSKILTTFGDAGKWSSCQTNHDTIKNTHDIILTAMEWVNSRNDSET